MHQILCDALQSVQDMFTSVGPLALLAAGFSGAFLQQPRPNTAQALAARKASAVISHRH